MKSLDFEKKIECPFVLCTIPLIFKIFQKLWKKVEIQFSPLQDICHIGVCPKWSRTFIEFSELSESHKSMKHEQGSI